MYYITFDCGKEEVFLTFKNYNYLLNLFCEKNQLSKRDMCKMELQGYLYKERLEFFVNYLNTQISLDEFHSFRDFCLVGEEATENVSRLLLAFCQLNPSFYLSKTQGLNTPSFPTYHEGDIRYPLGNRFLIVQRGSYKQCWILKRSTTMSISFDVSKVKKVEGKLSCFNIYFEDGSALNAMELKNCRGITIGANLRKYFNEIKD